MPQIIAGEKTYEVGELSLGEFRLLKKRFGVERMDLLDPRDPDHLVGLCVVGALRENPQADVDAIVAELDSVTEVDFKKDGEDDPEAPLASTGSSSGSQPSERDDAPAGSS